ncbi:MAG: hypothetical protein ACR2FM_04990 [Candidatus Saccharimonadales bacterium]
MEFARGDGTTKGFWIPATAWTAGGTLFFAAKALIDDDNTDALALISGNWSDADVTDETRGGVAYKRYGCYFPPSATSSIVSDGAESLELLGEFQFVPAGGAPITFPPTDAKIAVTVWFDVKRKTIV